MDRTKKELSLADGTFYYFIDSFGEVCRETWFGYPRDKMRSSIGNIFLKKNEAVKISKLLPLVFRAGRRDPTRLMGILRKEDHR